MTDLKTSETLLKALREAAVSQLTAVELQEQRISFIMASLDKKSNVTRDKVVHVLKRQLGEKAV